MIVQTLPGSNYYELQACIECAKIAMQTHLYITKINYLTQVLWYFLWMKFGFTCTSLLRHQAASLRLWYIVLIVILITQVHHLRYTDFNDILGTLVRE